MSDFTYRKKGDLWLIFRREYQQEFGNALGIRQFKEHPMGAYRTQEQCEKAYQKLLNAQIRKQPTPRSYAKPKHNNNGHLKGA